MTLVTGRVVAGKVVVEGEPLEEGATVTVLMAGRDDSFELNPSDEADLLSAIDESNRGEFVDGNEFLSSLTPKA